MTKCNHSSDRRCVNCDDSIHCYPDEAIKQAKSRWTRLVERWFPVPPVGVLDRHFQNEVEK